MNSTKTTSSAQVLKKTQLEEFDLVILGGGTGSTIAAWTFAGQGQWVAIIERKYIGGSCPKPQGSQSVRFGESYPLYKEMSSLINCQVKQVRIPLCVKNLSGVRQE